MSVETAIIDLTTKTTELLSSFTTQRDSVAQQIADAVEISANESQIPLAIVATNLITTQAMVVSLINR